MLFGYCVLKENNAIFDLIDILLGTFYITVKYNQYHWSMRYRSLCYRCCVLFTILDYTFDIIYHYYRFVRIKSVSVFLTRLIDTVRDMTLSIIKRDVYILVNVFICSRTHKYINAVYNPTTYEYNMSILLLVTIDPIFTFPLKYPYVW